MAKKSAPKKPPNHASNAHPREEPSPTLAGKPKTLAQYMADKGRAMREHVGLPPMPQLTPCKAPSKNDSITLAMCYLHP